MAGGHRKGEMTDVAGTEVSVDWIRVAPGSRSSVMIWAQLGLTCKSMLSRPAPLTSLPLLKVKELITPSSVVKVDG